MARRKKIDEKEQQVSFASLAGIEETAPIEEKKTTRKKSNSTNNKEEKTTTVKKESTKSSASSSKSSTAVNKSNGASSKSATSKNSGVKSTKTTTTKKKTTPKKDRKINITQEDMDKLCEVYDWYLSVKDTISYNAATEEDSKNKDVVIEETELKDTKKAYLNIDRQTWEDFDVLCSNCGFKKNEVLTQIIKDFLREHRNLF